MTKPSPYEILRNPDVLGLNIRWHRERLGLSQVALAMRSGVSAVRICQLETGAQGNIYVTSALRLAKALGITVEELMEDVL